MAEPQECRPAALALLARREHSALELRRKLEQRGHAPEAVSQTLAALSAEGLLDEGRFVEAYIASRLDKGIGPLRLRAELRERGIGDGLIETHLEAVDDWAERAEAVRRKRFGAAPPQEFKERARQARFLEYRGFSPEQVRRALRADE